jgi:hypothetical protein
MNFAVTGTQIKPSQPLITAPSSKPAPKKTPFSKYTQITLSKPKPKPAAGTKGQPSKHKK